MSSSSSPLISCDSETKGSSAYSRKEKSLGVLCSNFLKLYNRDDVESIELDNAACQLGVERRRIYDIVNILESVGVLTRKAKNQYSWKGFAAIPRALEILKEGGLQQKFNAFIDCNALSDDRDHKQPINSKTGNPEKNSEVQKDGRKEKSLGLLAQNFVKLFICSNEELISLDQAAFALLGDTCDPTSMRTRLRRLYDIANVLVSINLIEKIRHPESGKPAFKWIGEQGRCRNGPSSAFNVHESKRRAFGSDVTNTCSKRYKADYLLDGKLTEKENVQKCALLPSIKNGSEKILSEQHQKRASKDFVFGPFKPSGVHKMRVSNNKKVELMEDWENLAPVFQPRYRNQAIANLFSHYVESWKSWNDEADDKLKKQRS